MQKQSKSISILITTWMISAGCQPNPPAQPRMPTELAAGSQALADNQPDAAISDSEAYLRREPHGPSAAGAHYIQGRAYEMKLATDRGEQRSLLVAARTAYQLALNDLTVSPTPDPALESDVRAQLSNVAYYQDDFAAAIEQAQIAYNMVEAPQLKRILLYRVATSQQRLGRFSDAEMTYNQIQQRYPGTAEAAAAAAQKGHHEFFVQLGTYNSPNGTAQVVSSLSGRGGPLEDVPTASRNDAAGHTIWDAGPFTTYPAAKQVRDAVQRDFPAAVVVP